MNENMSDYQNIIALSRYARWLDDKGNIKLKLFFQSAQTSQNTEENRSHVSIENSSVVGRKTKE